MTTAPVPHEPADRTPTSNPVFRRALLWSGLVAAAIALVGGVLGFALAGTEGLFGALIGTLLSVTFMGITAVSILVANRFAGNEMFVGTFFAIVMGGWILKFVVFLAIVLALRGATWVDPLAFFLSVVAGVLGSLAVDVIVVARTRMPVVDVALPKASPEE